MALTLPELTDIDFTTLDFDGIISLSQKIIRNHPDYFSDIDDFTESNAGRMTIELVSYIVELLADRVDWIANELTLPTATQKQSVMNLLKLINYRLELPKAAAVSVTATINEYVNPFVLPPRYSIPATDREGNSIKFELLQKNDSGQYVYEGSGSNYEFDTGYQATPVLSHNNLVFYEGTSRREIFTMTGRNNETVLLGNRNVEEGSIRVFRISRSASDEIISKRELPIVKSFISPEAQSASDSDLPPLRIQPTENNSVHLVFGERPVVATFNPSGSEEILVWYRTTKGENGNIVRNAINYTTTLSVSGRRVQMSFINSIAGSGGAKSESLEHAKRYGPLSLTTVQKTVNPDDFVVILQNFGSLINAIAYGKSNEPADIFDEVGHYIPPYETWIYPIFNQEGWESLPSYSYNKSFQVNRPYVKYGPIDKETIFFNLDEGPYKMLNKLHLHSKADSYTNVVVSNLYNTLQYTPGSDFVIDLEARQIVRLEGGEIGPSDVVVVQYFENEMVDADVTIDFSTGSRQPIPNGPIFPGAKTYAWSFDLQKEFVENELSTNDYNYPSGDYRIDYTTNEIIKNETYPALISRESFGIENNIISGINNEFIISFNGMNRTQLNADHDFIMSAYSAWAIAGNGLTQALSPGLYYFKIGVDGSDIEEYEINLAQSAYTTRELVDAISTLATRVSDGEPFSNLPIELFADSFWFPQSPRLTFMSKSSGISSNIELQDGSSGPSLFNLNNLSTVEKGAGEAVGVLEVAQRARATLNSMGLLDTFAGQSLDAGEEEKPEVYSIANVSNPSSFSFPGTNNEIVFRTTGTNLGTWDGDWNVSFTNASSTYDLTTIQGRMDLIDDMQNDIDSTLDQDIIEVFWVPAKQGIYRIGFRQQDTTGSVSPSITILRPGSNSALSKLQMTNMQSSKDSNLVEARVDPGSNMTSEFFLRIELFGAFGSQALIQVKASNALHNNSLSFLKYKPMQHSKGSGILIRTILGTSDIIDDGSLSYTFTTDYNNSFTLTISGGPSGISDGDYKITIPDGTYNILELVAALNEALSIAEITGTPVDVSSFIVFEKREGLRQLRIRMTDFNINETPLIVITTNSGEIEESQRAIDKLGFKVNDSTRTQGTILLHYQGNWISDTTADQSQERALKNYLADKRLIMQDYEIKDPKLTSFDVKGAVYCAKGFDRAVIKDQVNRNIRSNFEISNREFAENAPITNITRLIESVEGTVFTNIDYFGKDYQLFKNMSTKQKSAEIIAEKPAENTVSRWSPKSAFKITIDGTALSGLNFDGEYIIEIGNSWENKSYNSLLDVLLNGDGTTGGLSHALPLSMGKSATNIGTALKATHNSGIFRISSRNEGPSVMIKIEDPDKSFTYGYQTFTRDTDLLESEYGSEAVYSINASIDGGSLTVYSIDAPASGEWSLQQIASQLDDQMPSSVTVGVDDNNKVRITSMLGGNQSTIDISSGSTGLDLLVIMNSVDDPVDGSHGYKSCVNLENDGSFFFGSSVTQYGLEPEPSKLTAEAAYNYKTSIPAGYNEVLYVSDNYYEGEVNNFENQLHGLIFEFVELGNNNG